MKKIYALKYNSATGETSLCAVAALEKDHGEYFYLVEIRGNGKSHFEPVFAEGGDLKQNAMSMIFEKTGSDFFIEGNEMSFSPENISKPKIK